MLRRVLLVDLSNVTYRAVCSHAGLMHDGKPTGGVYGFLQIICKLVNDHSINRIVVADDTKPYFRTMAYPDYKAARSHAKTSDPVATETLSLVKLAKLQIASMLERVNVAIAAQNGYEADDLIAKTILCNPLAEWRFFVGSNDSDLYQLLWDYRVSICRKQGLYRHADFRKEFGVKALKWPRVLALAGSHNGVPGISGVGFKTAAALVNDQASERYIQHRYGVSAEQQRLRELLSTYPWRQDGALLDSIHVQKFKFKRRQMTAWLYDRFGIEFAPYMQTAFESLAQ